VSAKYEADDRGRFPFLPCIFTRGRLGVDVVPPLRLLAAMHLLLDILLKVTKEWNQIAIVRSFQVLPMYRSSTNDSRSLFIFRGGPGELL